MVKRFKFFDDISGNMKKLLLLISILSYSLLYSSEYCAGDVISDVHQNTSFNECYPEGCDDCDDTQPLWSLSEFAGNIIFLDLSAAWCAPCYAQIDFLDELEAYWHNTDPNVKFVTALTDVGEPYSCDQWGNAGISGVPLIVNDEEEKLFNWFGDSNQQYPSFVIIDHTMTVRGKPSSFYTNFNTNSCDGNTNNLTDWYGGSVNNFIDELLDEYYEDMGSTEACNDGNACNTGSLSPCRYAQENYTCDGECAVDVDCAGICGGDTDDCNDTGFTCENCTIVEEGMSIQSAINSAADGDTIVVETGVYVENLVIEKSLTLGSRALLQSDDDLATWFSYVADSTGSGYEVSNEYIEETVIDGSGADSSVILINSPQGECINVEIFGFTIQGGAGT